VIYIVIATNTDKRNLLSHEQVWANAIGHVVRDRIILIHKNFNQ